MSIILIPSSFSEGSRITAPAPSARRTHVVLSVQSVNFESISAPTTSALRDAPVLINFSAIDRA